ncbi:MAG: class IV adenylate cyclase [Patescibacteria group bacterium]
MKEIEVKAKLRDRKTVVNKLQILGCVLEKPLTQKDVIYVRNAGSLADFNNNTEYLRIRIKSNGKILFTVKKNAGNGLAKLEQETEIVSAGEMEKALLLMGYKEGVRVNKVRVTTTYNGCEICIDEVEGLGSFIEMEEMSNDVDVEKIQEELFEFFKTLGVEEKDRVHVGYDVLMLQK